MKAAIKPICGVIFLVWAIGPAWWWWLIPVRITPAIFPEADRWGASLVGWYMLLPMMLFLSTVAGAIVVTVIWGTFEWAFGGIRRPALTRHQKTLRNIEALERWHEEHP